MRNRIGIVILCVLIPAAVLLGAFVFEQKRYAYVSLAVAILACVPFFLSFEKKGVGSKRLIIIAAMTALSVVGRLVFAAVPGFKPVTATVVITAMYFGKEAGFMTGALSAVISNFYFGQGPWTPFQMFTWGIIGFIAGVLANPLKRSRIILCVYGALAGVAFSLLMDVWTTLWADGYFNLSRYLAYTVTALPFTAAYALSNIVFLLLAAKPLGRIFERLKIKYSI